MAGLLKRASGLGKRVILPEATDARILQAASLAHNQGIARPILIGKEDDLRKAAAASGVDLSGLEIVEPGRDPRLGEYAKTYSRQSGTPLRTAKLIVRQPLFFAALALRAGHADGMLGGAAYTSAEFESVCLAVIGLRRGIKAPSSFFIMETRERTLLYADASVTPNPTAAQLAGIAIATGRSAQDLLGWRPRVAMLSFSTKGSATHPDVDKVVQATAMARRMARGTGIMVDGELQADAALVPATAKRKVPGDLGLVAGQANVLVFPDLDAANIAYKLTQILAGAHAYGPILQGFRKPLSDLSRGATVEDIVGAIAIVALLAEAA
jgi:phosphate acetyltransferase